MDCTRHLVKYICIFSATCSTCRAAVMLNVNLLVLSNDQPQPPDDSHYLLAKRDLLAISYPGPGDWWNTWGLTLLLLTS